MVHLNYSIFIISVFIISMAYLFTEKLSIKIFKMGQSKVVYENATEALKNVSTWTTWLTGLQTAAIASMALLTKDKIIPLTEVQKNYGFFTLLFFGASIILSTWLLSAIPSIQQRLINSTTPEKENDIYRMKIFSFIPFSLGRFSGLVHTYFLIGIIAFALFIFSLF